VPLQLHDFSGRRLHCGGARIRLRGGRRRRRRRRDWRSGRRRRRGAHHRICSALLDDMRQLVRQEMFAFSGMRRVLAPVESDIASHGEGARIDGACRLCGLGVRVNAHTLEVGAEPRLEELTRRNRQWTPAAVQRHDVGRDRWRDLRRSARALLQLNLLFLVLLVAMLARAVHRNRGCSHGRCIMRVHSGGLRHPHDFIRDSIGFTFLRIARAAQRKPARQSALRWTVPGDRPRYNLRNECLGPAIAETLLERARSGHRQSSGRGHRLRLQSNDRPSRQGRRLAQR
jgi:hypothetical protein